MPTTIDAERHMVWARGIARGVRADYRFLADSQEELELEAAAYLVLVLKAAAFDFSRVPAGGDPDEQFRGLNSREVRTNCQREAQRLRNGGTYHTTRDPAGRPRTDGTMPTDDSCDQDREARRRGVRTKPPARDRAAEGVPLPLFEDADFSCYMLPAGCRVEGDVDLRSWVGAVGKLATQQNNMLWALGDLILYGVSKFGPDARDMLGATGYAGETERKAEYVCRRFPVGMRIPDASFAHHRVVACLLPAKARKLLRRAAEENLSTRALRVLVRELKAGAGAPAASARGVLNRLEMERLPAACVKFGVAADVVLAVLWELRAG